MLAAELGGPDRLFDELARMYGTAAGAEKAAIAYALSRQNRIGWDAFVDAIPEDEAEIRKLLDIDGGIRQGTYLREPFGYIASWLGEAARHSDKALPKLKRLDLFSDGWLGDVIRETIFEIEQGKGQ